jgi:hypothetical protein
MVETSERLFRTQAIGRVAFEVDVNFWLPQPFTSSVKRPMPIFIPLSPHSKSPGWRRNAERNKHLWRGFMKFAVQTTPC